MLRLQTFDCAKHRHFEVLLEIDPRDHDGRFEAVRSHACGVCGEASPAVIGAPRVKSDTVHAIELGGRTMRRDDVEQFLSDGPAKKENFYDSPTFEQDFLNKVDEKVGQFYAGTLPPAEVITDKQATDAITKAIKE